MKSLAWLLALTFGATVCMAHYGAPGWLVVIFAIFDCIGFVVYVAAYIYFALTNPDLLRSERYGLQKMAIEKGYIGDDATGWIKVHNVETGSRAEIAKPDQKRLGDA